VRFIEIPEMIDLKAWKIRSDSHAKKSLPSMDRVKSRAQWILNIRNTQ
jgi:hypothetical protein